MGELEQPRRTGYWTKNEYYRLNVDFIDCFCGWRTLQELIDYAESPRNKSFFSALFLTGGRVTEVLGLKRENFIVRELEKVIIVRDMPLEKRYKKLEEVTEGKEKHWITEKIHARRKDFPLDMREPLVPTLLEWVKQSNGLLFPSPYKPDGPLSRFWGYKLIRRMDEQLPSTLREDLGLNKPFRVKDKIVKDTIHLWLHWFRSQRASQLVRDYGFELLDLLKFFAWEKVETALHYAQKGWRDLATKMQTTEIQYV